MAKTEYEAGAVFEVRYPFLRTVFKGYDEENGEFEQPSWKPGAEFTGEDYRGRSVYVANGEGKQIVTVVSVHQPGRFPTRVFFTRKWVTPDGVTFGKNALKIKTADAFRRMVRGYAFGYRVEDAQPTAVQLLAEVPHA